ncbi:MAG: pyridoxamine 5'-phosphate oxidase family protein [Acidobacteriota bacterium]|jgi:3-hydroxyisobutyrate dehydrogenase|nr:pyridoxamine 5'-phosphate oxidase family protein [Acidobacteriota bacterium]
MNSIWDKPISHGDILKKVWKNLDLGVIDRKHPFHTPVFGTENGVAPSLRIVVLRRFWRKPAKIAFHSHIGSPKIEQIKKNPNVSYLFYNTQENLQARIKGVAKIHTDDELAEEQWNATALFSRRCYIGEAPTQISKKPTHGMPKEITERDPTKEESEIGRANFVVISTAINEIDCLELDVKGNRRSLFKWNEDGSFEMKWLTP